MNNDLKSSEALKAHAREVLCGNNPMNSLLIRMFDEIIDNAPTVETFTLEDMRKAADIAHSYGRLEEKTERPQGEWIAVTYRPMTDEEEKEFCEKLGIKEGSLEDWEKKVFTCHLPDDGQEILTSCGKYVQEDVCSWDEYGCGLENNGDWDGIDAWMPKPEPYKKEDEENG